MEKSETNGYNLAHFFLSNAISRLPVMDVAIANYSNDIWALATMLRNVHPMKLKTRLRSLPLGFGPLRCLCLGLQMAQPPCCPMDGVQGKVPKLHLHSDLLQPHGH